jgi:hypothetical protein
MDVGAADLCEAYRRQARRIRARLHDRPHKLLTSLRDLAGRQDSSRSLAAPATPAQQFIQVVTSRLGNGVLAYSDRLALVQQAAEFGIDRFQANLIIAALQHQLQGVATGWFDRQGKSNNTMVPLLMFLFLQAAIVLATWIVVR